MPGSRVLVGSRVAVSRGLRRHWTDKNVDRALGLQSVCLECPEGHVYVAQSLNAFCPACGLKPCKAQQLVSPRFGYTTAAWDPPKRETDPERVGEQRVCPIAFLERNQRDGEPRFANFENLKVTYREDTPLLVRNGGERNRGFAICTRCGFSMSEFDHGNGRMGLPNGFERHAPIFSPDAKKFCWQKVENDAPCSAKPRPVCSV